MAGADRRLAASDAVLKVYSIMVDRAAWPSQDASGIKPGKELEMPDTPTFGRYAEIPYDQMTPEQQEGYRSMIESRGGLPGPSKIWVHNPKLAKVAGPFGGHFPPRRYSLTGGGGGNRGLRHHQQIPFRLPNKRA